MNSAFDANVDLKGEFIDPKLDENQLVIGPPPAGGKPAPKKRRSTKLCPVCKGIGLTYCAAECQRCQCGICAGEDYTAEDLEAM